jgi:hypothetical protein
MISVDIIIHRFRRDMTLGRVARGALLIAAMAAFFIAPAVGAGIEGALVVASICVTWVLLSARGIQSSRLAQASSDLIASGHFEEAEEQIDSVLRKFSLFQNVKLIGLHHLAVLRHAQRRWQDAAALCHAFLSQKLGTVQNLSKPSRLLLVDALLQLNDVRAAYAAMAPLYQQKLSLSEALSLQHLQLDYLCRVGAWDQLLGDIGTKVQLAELMPPSAAARSQAILALAATKLGRPDLADWLRRRAELLTDPEKLISDRPVLSELWPKP